MSRVSGAKPQGVFSTPRDLNLRPNEMRSNPSYDTADPTSLVQKVLRKHPSIPPLPAYPAALVADARLVERAKDRSHMLLIDAAMQRTWLHDARLNAVHQYVANWHREVHDDRQAFELAWVHKELLRRDHFFRAVLHIMLQRERGITKARHLQSAVFRHLRELSLNRHVKVTKEAQRLMKQGLLRHASFLAWRLDNLYAQSQQHSVIKVKHGGHQLEKVAGEVMWYMRHQVTKGHHDWRQGNLVIETATHGIVRVKHGGRMEEEVMDHLAWEARRQVTKALHAWRLDNLYIQLANGSLAQVHHAPGQSQQRVSEEIEQPKLGERRRANRRWHDSNREVETANHALVHEAGLGHMPEQAAAHLREPVLRRMRKEAFEHKGSLNLIKLPNGGTIHTLKGAIPGRSPELVLAEVHRPHEDKVKKDDALFRQSHMVKETANHGIAPLKGHGLSYEHVAATTSDHPRARSHAGFKLWREAHTFTTGSDHQIMPIKKRGRSYEAITALVAARYKELVTRHYLQHRLADRYTKTGNGGWRHLDRIGKSLEHVTAEVMPPDEGTPGKPPVVSAGGHPLAAAKLVQEIERRRDIRRDLQFIQRSIAAHQQTSSLLVGHVVSQTPATGAVNAGTPPPERAQVGKKV